MKKGLPISEKVYHEEEIPDELREYFEEVPISDYPRKPAVVADIFCGSGTTGLVARELGRNFVGLDLSHAYLSELAAQRVDVPLSLF